MQNWGSPALVETQDNGDHVVHTTAFAKGKNGKTFKIVKPTGSPVFKLLPQCHIDANGTFKYVLIYFNPTKEYEGQLLPLIFMRGWAD